VSSGGISAISTAVGHPGLLLRGVMPHANAIEAEVHHDVAMGVKRWTALHSSHWCIAMNHLKPYMPTYSPISSRAMLLDVGQYSGLV